LASLVRARLLRPLISFMVDGAYEMIFFVKGFFYLRVCFANTPYVYFDSFYYFFKRVFARYGLTKAKQKR